jgi:hypothetical protein
LSDPPSYNVAAARATQSAIGRPVEPRTFANALTLASLEGSLTELEFVQGRGAVVGTRKSSPTILDRVRGLAQRDADIGEAMVRPSSNNSTAPEQRMRLIVRIGLGHSGRGPRGPIRPGTHVDAPRSEEERASGIQLHGHARQIRCFLDAP